MKPPLIFLFTRDDDFAQSVREPLFGTGAVVLGLTILVAVSSYLVRGIRITPRVATQNPTHAQSRQGDSKGYLEELKRKRDSN